MEEYRGRVEQPTHLPNSQGSHWLAESGSTKTDWVCYAGPEVGRQFATQGINPSYLSLAQLEAAFSQALAHQDWIPNQVASFVWYGSGCAGLEPQTHLRKALQKYVPMAILAIEHDLMAAARAALGKEAGLVAILGTGSHCCTYTGKVIESEAVNLGYVLGDEGAGGDMGKRLLRAYFYRQLPQEELDYLAQALALTRDAAIDSIYRQPYPNRWLASLTKHLGARPFLRAFIATASLQAFKDTHLLPLAEATGYGRFSAIGSIAAHFEAELRQVCAPELDLVEAIGSPIKRLVEYHKRISIFG